MPMWCCCSWTQAQAKIEPAQTNGVSHKRLKKVAGHLTFSVFETLRNASRLISKCSFWEPDLASKNIRSWSAAGPHPFMEGGPLKLRATRLNPPLLHRCH